MATPSSIRRIATSSSPRFQCLNETTLRASCASTPLSSHSSSSRQHPSSRRHFASSPYISPESPSASTLTPRWRATPRGMSMPFRIRPMDKKNEWRCNDDPKKLNDFYNRMLGPGGESLLSEETKWLAVTHKSFDQGRRGFNDKMSYFGKRILSLHTSSSLLASPAIPQSLPTPDQYGRYPYEHPLLESLPNLSDGAKSAILSKNRLAQLGKDYGLQGVLRWQPKNVENLSGSGLELVMAQAVYAIVGAVALERGGVVASRVVRESVLKPFGLEGTEI